MSAARKKPPARLEARLPRDVHALLKRAADIQGRSLSDFVIAAAHDAAVRTIAAETIVRLSAADQQHFADALLGPAHDTPATKAALKRAKKRHADLIRG